jgi:hypothetical protein
MHQVDSAFKLSFAASLIFTFTSVEAAGDTPFLISELDAET